MWPALFGFWLSILWLLCSDKTFIYLNKLRSIWYVSACATLLMERPMLHIQLNVEHSTDCTNSNANSTNRSIEWSSHFVENHSKLYKQSVSIHSADCWKIQNTNISTRKRESDGRKKSRNKNKPKFFFLHSFFK